MASVWVLSQCLVVQLHSIKLISVNIVLWKRSSLEVKVRMGLQENTTAIHPVSRSRVSF